MSLRQNFWSGYYQVNTDKPNVLCGVEQTHYCYCGYLIIDGEEVHVSVFRLSKDNLPDTPFSDGIKEPNEAFDVILPVGDKILSIAHEDCTPIAQELISQDVDSGYDYEQILERRAGVMIPEFLGFTFDQIPDGITTKEIVDPELGPVIVYTIKRHHWEEL